MIEPQEQATKLAELAKIKAEMSMGFYAIAAYRTLIEKVLSLSEILTEEECTLATSKEFTKSIGDFAKAMAKTAQWHKENKWEDTIAFLTPNASELVIGESKEVTTGDRDID